MQTSLFPHSTTVHSTTNLPPPPNSGLKASNTVHCPANPPPLFWRDNTRQWFCSQNVFSASVGKRLQPNDEHLIGGAVIQNVLQHTPPNCYSVSMGKRLQATERQLVGSARHKMKCSTATSPPPLCVLTITVHQSGKGSKLMMDVGDMVLRAKRVAAPSPTARLSASKSKKLLAGDGCFITGVTAVLQPTRAGAQSLLSTVPQWAKGLVLTSFGFRLNLWQSSNGQKALRRLSYLSLTLKST
jgi:hypothetical protein